MNAERLLAHYEKIAEAPDAMARLRRLVLDLAVRGKLVPQDHKDEPASELLKRIDAKTTVSTAIKGKRSAPLAPDPEDTPVPNGWSAVSLARLIRVLNGRAYKQQELLSSGTPVLRVGNLFTSKHWYYSNLELDDDKYCDAGDLIYAWSASFGPFIWDGPKVIYHYHIWKMQLLSEEDLSKRYLYNYLLQKTREIKEAGHGISMVHMTKEKMEKLVVLLPPLAEQHRIVAKVDELMALCDQLEKSRTAREETRDRLTAASLARLNDPAPETFQTDARFALDALPSMTARPNQIKQLRQTILNLAVRGKLVPQDPSDEPASTMLGRFSVAKSQARKGRDWSLGENKSRIPSFEVPDGWVWTTIDEAVHRVTVGYVGPMKDQYVEEGVPFLRSQNVRANKFRSDGLIYISKIFHQRIIKSALTSGDVVVVRSGNVGTACVIPNTIQEGNCSDLVIVKKPECILPELLCFYLNSLAAEHVERGSVGVALTHFNTRSVATMPLPLPPLAEQKRIVAKITELMGICDCLEASLAAGETARSRLLDALLAEVIAPVDARRLEAAE